MPNERKSSYGPRLESSNSLTVAMENIFQATVCTSQIRNFPCGLSSTLLSWLGEVSSTFNFSSQVFMQTTSALLHSQLCLLLCPQRAASSLGINCEEPSEQTDWLLIRKLALAAFQALMRQKRCLHVRIV